MDKKMMPIMIGMLVLIIIGFYFAWQGIVMHQQVVVEENAFHALQTSYFGNSKAVRDAAVTGSQLTQDLVEIANYPSTLLQLKLVGIGKILTGIFVLLFAILIALMMMPKRLATVIRGQNG